MKSVMKYRQSQKIGEIGEALVSAGYVRLDQQAKVLGLSRSTTWTLVKHSHKASGLTANVINRMLAAPQLPPTVREKINEYVRERLAGMYGHDRMQRRRFASRLVNLFWEIEVSEEQSRNKRERRGARHSRHGLVTTR